MLYEKNGWYINWDTLVDDNEVYALVVQGSVDIQGLVALHKDDNAKAVYVTWMCSSPENNPRIMEVFGADFIGIQHPFHFMIDEEHAKKIMEVYTYEWTNDKI